jgi:hypothetical protein
MYHPLPLQEPAKFTQIWIFGLKANHLATLKSMRGDHLGVGSCVHTNHQGDRIGRIFA